MNIDAKMAEVKKYLDDGFSLEAARVYVSIAEHKEKQDPNSALDMYFNAIRLMKKESDFYRAAKLLLKAGLIYQSQNNTLEAGRQYSRAGSLFRDVKANDEASKAFAVSGDMFSSLKGEFYVEAGKHYKMSILSAIYHPQHQSAEYMQTLSHAEAAFNNGFECANISKWTYYLYLENLYLDIQNALERNGLANESSAMYLKRMKELTKRSMLNKRDWLRYFSLLLWEWTSGYGELPLRWVGCICLLLFGFSFIYYFSDMVHTAAGTGLSYFESLFFAFNIFVTLGFGSYELVTNSAYAVIIINVFLGYLMMAVLLTIIARKLTK